MAGDGRLGWFEVGRGLAEADAEQHLRFTFHGELDESNVDPLWLELEDAVARATADGHSPSALVVDLAAVHFMGSAGLRLLVRLRSVAGGAGVALVTLAPLGTPARRILQIAGMEDELGVWPEPPDGPLDSSPAGD